MGRDLHLGPGTKPVVAVGVAGDAVAAWNRADSVQASFLRSSSSSATWTAPSELGPGSEPQVALGPGGNAVAVWSDDGLHAALRPAASGAWLPAVAISAGGASGSQLATDGGGETLALWIRSAAVEAAELVGSGPIVAQLSVPAHGVVGVPVDLAVEIVPWAAPLAGDAAWTFGDGSSSATGSAVRHAYAAPGTYEISIAQSDAARGTSSSSARITIVRATLANLVRPSIRGRARIGGTLMCLRGRWTGTPPIRYAYGWLRNSRAVPAARRTGSDCGTAERSCPAASRLRTARAHAL